MAMVRIIGGSKCITNFFRGVPAAEAIATATPATKSADSPSYQHSTNRLTGAPHFKDYRGYAAPSKAGRKDGLVGGTLRRLIAGFYGAS